MKTEYTLEEAVIEGGSFVADSFEDGVCINIDKCGNVYQVEYKDADDFNPTKFPLSLYRGLFLKKYRKILTRHQLFRK